jgi:hypothetical protein
VDGERCRRPIDGLPRLGIFAGGELDKEATVELVGAYPRDGVEITDGGIRGSAAQSHPLAPETQREHEARPGSDATFAVGLDEEVPAVGPKLEAVVFNAADLGATARVVETQLAGRTVEPLHERIREDPAEGQGEARHDDVHLERRASGRVRAARANRLDRLVRSRSEHDEQDEAREHRHRDDDQRCLYGSLHAIHDRGRSWRWSNEAGPL